MELNVCLINFCNMTFGTQSQKFMGPVRKKIINCNKYTRRTILMDVFKNNLCVNRYMQCCYNSNNDKLALLDTIYNQTFKHFTHLGPVVQSWVSANPGLKFNPLF